MTTLSAYASVALLGEYLPDVNQTAQNARWTNLLTRASRFIDHQTDNYFGQITLGTPKTGTITAISAGATSLTYTVTGATAAPATGDVFTLDSGGLLEQLAVQTVTGTGPYTIGTTSPAQFAHGGVSLTQVNALTFQAESWPAIFPTFPIVSLSMIEMAAYFGSAFNTVSPSQWVLKPNTPKPNEPYMWLQIAPPGPTYAGYYYNDPVYNTYPSHDYLGTGYPTAPLCRLTGVFGYPSVPDDIVHLTCKIAARWWKAKDSGWTGVIGSVDTGLMQTKTLDTEDRYVLQAFSRKIPVG